MKYRRNIIFLIVLSLFLYIGNSFAQEQIVDFEDKSLPVLNEELKKLGNEIEESAVPTGAIVLWTTDTEPSGWVFCDGSAYDVTKDSTLGALYELIGNTFGGSDNTDFKVPDLRGRVPLGQDDMGGTAANRVTDTDADTVGNGDGAETVTLTGAQSGLQAHSHTVSFLDGYSVGHAKITGRDQTGGDWDQATSTNAAANASEAHTNMPPYITLNWIIKL